MCTNFVASARQEIQMQWPALQELPPHDWPLEVFLGQDTPVIMLDPQQRLVCRMARFGLMPAWCKDASHARTVARGTYNARSETAMEKPSFRGAWRKRQWALVPMQAFYEPCWERAAAHGGRSERWRMALADGSLMGVAGLWDRWVNPVDGCETLSVTLLTVNADGHAIAGRMHRPGEEKRMPAILSPQDPMRWLGATPQQAPALLQAYPAQCMQAQPAPMQGTAAPQPPENLSLF